MILTNPEQIDYFRFLSVMQAIKLYLRSGMKLTRAATPTNMRQWASEYTGKEYKRSRQGLEAALLDLEALKNRSDSK